MTTNAISLSVDDEYDDLDVERWLPALADRVLQSEQIDGAELSVLITDDETVRWLNRRYRGYDETTDVLSFGLSELAKPATDDEEPATDFVLPPGASRQLGEVVISYPTAQRQAQEHGRPEEMELAHLLIHGILHLLGHDHYEPEEERVMRACEEQLLGERLWERGESR